MLGRFPIRPLDKHFPEGKTVILVTEDDEELTEILTNPDPRICDEIDIISQSIENVKRVFAIYGKEVTKLFWGNSDNLQNISSVEVVDALNMLPNLKSLDLSPFNFNLDDLKDSKVNLKNLSELETSRNESEMLLKFYAKVLPPNSIKVLSIELKEGCKEFFENQNEIKELTIGQIEDKCEESSDEENSPENFYDFSNYSFIKTLKLEKLFCSFSSNKENLSKFRFFLNFVLENQINLKVLEVCKSSDYSNKLINDELLTKVCKLSSLEELFMSLDAITKIQDFENLKNLKKLKLKTIKKSSVILFNKLSQIKMDQMVDLTLDSMDFEIPSEVYENFAENMPNLKFLKVSLGTRHKINFYARTFKNLETLAVKFGTANDTVDLDSVFEFDTGIYNTNLKNLFVNFTNRSKINEEKFFEMLKMFPNLKVLSVDSNFPIDSKFFIKLAANLSKIQEIKFSHISIENDEQLTSKFLESLKVLASKLKYIFILFINEKFRGDPEVTYVPLNEALENIYNFWNYCYAIHCQVNVMKIFKGNPTFKEAFNNE